MKNTILRVRTYLLVAVMTIASLVVSSSVASAYTPDDNAANQAKQREYTKVFIEALNCDVSVRSYPVVNKNKQVVSLVDTLVRNRFCKINSLHSNGYIETKDSDVFFTQYGHLQKNGTTLAHAAARGKLVSAEHWINVCEKSNQLFTIKRVNGVYETTEHSCTDSKEEIKKTFPPRYTKITFPSSLCIIKVRAYETYGRKGWVSIVDTILPAKGCKGRVHSEVATGKTSKSADDKLQNNGTRLSHVATPGRLKNATHNFRTCSLSGNFAGNEKATASFKKGVRQGNYSFRRWNDCLASY